MGSTYSVADDLPYAGEHGNRDQRAHDAGELRAAENGQEHRQRVQAGGAAHELRHEQLALEEIRAPEQEARPAPPASGSR